jgi:CHASE3 domain sensor protein
MTAAGRLAGALAVLVGGAVLLGWALDVAALKSVLPGWVSMKRTAIVFAVLGVALFLVVWPEIAAFCSLGRKTTAAYVLGLVLVVFIGLTSSRSVLWLDETAHRVNHAEQVLGAISDVMSEIAKAQSHTRGYVITGGERYLQAEQMAAARCREALVRLRQLISDPAQKARVVRLEAQADELIGWFSQVIAARSAGSAGTAPSDMIDHGEDLMDSLRALVAQMDDAQLLLLQQWQRDSSNVSRFTHLVIITGTAVGLIIFLSVLFGLNRAETEGRQAQATLAAGIDDFLSKPFKRTELAAILSRRDQTWTVRDQTWTSTKRPHSPAGA